MRGRVDVLDAAQRLDAFLDRTRDMHGPARVTTEAAQLAEDRRQRERGERHAAAGVEAAGGLDEAEICDLLEVFAPLAGAGVAVCEPARQPPVFEHERLDVVIAARGHGNQSAVWGRRIDGSDPPSLGRLATNSR